MVNTKKYLLLSIRPEFAKKIITREKRIELRKVKPDVQDGDYVVIYASSPLKSIIGFGIIRKIIEASPQQMWARYSPLLGIDKQRFDNYYDGKEKAIGIEMYKIRRISPIHLKILRNFTPHFQPPQVYRYISNIEICELITNSECCYRENANAQNTLL